MRQLNSVLTVLLLVGLGIPVPAVAQSVEFDPEPEAFEKAELETDRDAFTPATSTIGKHFTVFETSYTFIDNKNVADTHSFPETLVRYGISDRIELRMGWNYEVGGSGESVSGDGGGNAFDSGTTESESQILYGIKFNVSEQSGWVPRSAFILQGYTPTSGEAPATDVLAAYIFGWELKNGWRLDSSWRYGTEHGPEDQFNQWAPSVVLRAPLTERWNVHAEYFGIFSDGAERETSRSYFSPGTHYLLTENLELGVRVGWGLTPDSPNFFSNVGLGWRF